MTTKVLPNDCTCDCMWCEKNKHDMCGFDCLLERKEINPAHSNPDHVCTESCYKYNHYETPPGYTTNFTISKFNPSGTKIWIESMYEMIPDFVNSKYPKGNKERGKATVYIALFVKFIEDQLK